MQTITLSSTEQALVSHVVEWFEQQNVLLNQESNRRLASILQDHELLGKTCRFSKQEDGSWVIELPPEESPDAVEEGKV